MFRNFLFNRNLWERPIFDLWMIPHLLSGTLIALILKKKNFSTENAFYLNLLIAIFWEGFEHVFKLSEVEYLSNSIGDIVIAQVGFALGILIFNKLEQKQTTIFIWTIGVVFILSNLLGWLAYRNYVNVLVG